MFNDIYLLVVLLCSLSGLISFVRRGSLALRIFSLYIILVLITESFAIFWPRIVIKYSLHYSAENHWIYNLYMIGGYCFYIYAYKYVIQSKKILSALNPIALLFIVLSLANIIFGQGLYSFNSYTALLAGCIATFLSLTYFHQLVHSSFLTKISKDPFFWISTGSFLFHLTTMLGLFFIVFLNSWYGKAAIITSDIIKTSSILMYLFYTIAFLCQMRA